MSTTINHRNKNGERRTFTIDVDDPFELAAIGAELLSAALRAKRPPITSFRIKWRDTD